MEQDGLKRRLARGDVLLGTWQKTPSHIVTEVLGRTALDLICLDAEHAPFDRGDLDASIMAARSKGMPCLVRVPDSSPAAILNALDLGATGVVVPHIVDRRDAQSAVAKTSYGVAGGRGYAGSTRAAEYTGRAMTGNLTEARETVVVIGQIEDQGSLDHLDEIMTVDGIDCFFVGRADLAVALGAASITDSIVLEASERIVEAARRAGRRTGMFVSDLKETRRWVDLGVSLFLLESDQSFLLSGAKSLKDRFELACGAPLRGTGPS